MLPCVLTEKLLVAPGGLVPALIFHKGFIGPQVHTHGFMTIGTVRNQFRGHLHFQLCSIRHRKIAVFHKNKTLGRRPEHAVFIICTDGSFIPLRSRLGTFQTPSVKSRVFLSCLPFSLNGHRLPAAAVFRLYNEHGIDPPDRKLQKAHPAFCGFRRLQRIIQKIPQNSCKIHAAYIGVSGEFDIDFCPDAFLLCHRYFAADKIIHRSVPRPDRLDDLLNRFS